VPEPLHTEEIDAVIDAEELLEPALPDLPLQTIEAALPTPESLPEVVEPHLVERDEPEPLPAPVAELQPEIIQAEPQQPRVILPKKKPLAEVKPVVEKYVQAKQETLQFESITRGRFEKSEPTIIEGQDLDVPTYLRKNVRVK